MPEVRINDSTGDLPERRIVVGVDGSPGSLQALRWAAGEAALRGVAVHAVQAWHYPYLVAPVATPIEMEFEQIGKAAEASLSQAIRDVLGDDPAVPVRTSVVEDSPAIGLLREAVGAELIVVGSRGHGGFAGLLLGSVSQQIVHHAPCPVVIITKCRTRA